jgi:hypothetical protein
MKTLEIIPIYFPLFCLSIACIVYELATVVRAYYLTPRKPFLAIKRSTLGISIVLRSPIKRVWLFNVTIAPTFRTNHIILKPIAFALLALLFIACESPTQSVNCDPSNTVEWYTDITPQSIKENNNPWVDTNGHGIIYKSDYRIRLAKVTAFMHGDAYTILFATCDECSGSSYDWLEIDFGDLPNGWESLRVSIVADTVLEINAEGK